MRIPRIWIFFFKQRFLFFSGLNLLHFQEFFDWWMRCSIGGSRRILTLIYGLSCCIQSVTMRRPVCSIFMVMVQPLWLPQSDLISFNSSITYFHYMETLLEPEIGTFPICHYFLQLNQWAEIRWDKGLSSPRTIRCWYEHPCC